MKVFSKSRALYNFQSFCLVGNLFNRYNIFRCNSFIILDSSQHASKRLQHRPKTASSGQGASQGGPREANILQTHMEKQYDLPPRLFASDGLLRPQDGSKMAQEGPKAGPRAPKSAPRSPQEGPKRLI